MYVAVYLSVYYIESTKKALKEFHLNFQKNWGKNHSSYFLFFCYCVICEMVFGVEKRFKLFCFCVAFNPPSLPASHSFTLLLSPTHKLSIDKTSGSIYICDYHIHNNNNKKHLE